MDFGRGRRYLWMTVQKKVGADRGWKVDTIVWSVKQVHFNRRGLANWGR